MMAGPSRLWVATRHQSRSAVAGGREVRRAFSVVAAGGVGGLLCLNREQRRQAPLNSLVTAVATNRAAWLSQFAGGQDGGDRHVRRGRQMACSAWERKRDGDGITPRGCPADRRNLPDRRYLPPQTKEQVPMERPLPTFFGSQQLRERRHVAAVGDSRMAVPAKSFMRMPTMMSPLGCRRREARTEELLRWGVRASAVRHLSDTKNSDYGLDGLGGGDDDVDQSSSSSAQQHGMELCLSPLSSYQQSSSSLSDRGSTSSSCSSSLSSSLPSSPSEHCDQQRRTFSQPTIPFYRSPLSRSPISPPPSPLLRQSSVDHQSELEHSAKTNEDANILRGGLAKVTGAASSPPSRERSTSKSTADLSSLTPVSSSSSSPSSTIISPQPARLPPASPVSSSSIASSQMSSSSSSSSSSSLSSLEESLAEVLTNSKTVLKQVIDELRHAGLPSRVSASSDFPHYIDGRDFKRTSSSARWFAITVGLALSGMVGLMMNWKVVKRKVGRKGAEVVSEGIQHEEFRETAEEVGKSLVTEILSDAEIRAKLSKFLATALGENSSTSTDAGGEQQDGLLLQFLKNEKFAQKLSDTMREVLKKLTASEDVEKICANFLVKTIKSKEVTDGAAQWFGEFLERTDVTEMMTKFMNDSVILDPDTSQNVTDVLTECSKEVMASSDFRDHASKALWHSIRSTLFPWHGLFMGGSSATGARAGAQRTAAAAVPPVTSSLPSPPALSSPPSSSVTTGADAVVDVSAAPACVVGKEPPLSPPTVALDSVEEAKRAIPCAVVKSKARPKETNEKDF